MRCSSLKTQVMSMDGFPSSDSRSDRDSAEMTASACTGALPSQPCPVSISWSTGPNLGNEMLCLPPGLPIPDLLTSSVLPLEAELPLSPVSDSSSSTDSIT